MAYDSKSGLPSKESFYSFASHFILREDSSRFAILAIRIFMEKKSDLSKESVNNYLLLSVIQKFIRKQDYILSACRGEDSTLLCFIDCSLLSNISLKDSLTLYEDIFLKEVENEFPLHHIKLKMGIAEHETNTTLKTTIQNAVNTLEILIASLATESCMLYKPAKSINQLYAKDILTIYDDGHLPQHIIIYLQPRFDISLEQVKTAEALIRIVNNRGKMLKPESFLSIFEENKLCAVLDLTVMERILILINDWMKCGITPIPLAVHLTTASLFSPVFFSICSQLLEKYTAAASYLQIELSDSCLAYFNQFENVLTLFQKYGTDILLETKNLQTVPALMPHTSFIDSIIVNRSSLLFTSQYNQNAKIAKSFFELCNSHDIRVICRNIEAEEEASAARENNISLMQGFYFGRPVPLDIFQKKYLNYIFVSI